MIDPNIITRGAERAQLQQQQNMEMLGNLGGALGQMVMGRRMNQMRQLKTPEEQQNFANNSIFSPYLNQALKADQDAQQKAALDALKLQADIGNINAQAAERNANAGNTTQKTGAGKFDALRPVWSVLAQSGNPVYAKQVLDQLKATGGAIDDDAYSSISAQLSNLDPNDPERLKSIGMQYMKGMIDPKYQFQTVDNEADNRTSRENNQNTVNATMRGQDITAKTADKNRTQEKIIAEQKLALERGEFETMTGTDGKAYAVYRNGQVEPLLLGTGEAFTPQAKKANGQPKLSDTALKAVNEMNIQLSSANQNSQKINGLIGDIQSGRLNLSAANQLGAKTKNFLGMSDENSRGVENFQTALNQAVNDVLMMAKGTQTEGDAQRAATVIAANPPRDNAAALQALQRLATVQKNTIGVLNQNINGIYDNYGVPRQTSQPKPNAQANPNQAKLNRILFGR